MQKVGPYTVVLQHPGACIFAKLLGVCPVYKFLSSPCSLVSPDLQKLLALDACKSHMVSAASLFAGAVLGC